MHRLNTFELAGSNLFQNTVYILLKQKSGLTGMNTMVRVGSGGGLDLMSYPYEVLPYRT